MLGLVGTVLQIPHLHRYFPDYLETPTKWSQLDWNYVNIDLVQWKTSSLLYSKAHINCVAGLELVVVLS
jgi:hypothetical protein